MLIFLLLITYTNFTKIGDKTFKKFCRQCHEKMDRFLLHEFFLYKFKNVQYTANCLYIFLILHQNDTICKLSSFQCKTFLPIGRILLLRECILVCVTEHQDTTVIPVFAPQRFGPQQANAWRYGS